MERAIRDFPSQFSYRPVIKNARGLTQYRKFILAGMGGSHLAGDLLYVTHPYLDIIIHKDYGLPELLKSELKKRLIIVSSYSGNTEEAISSLHEALKHDYAVAVVAAGGALLKIAREKKLPYVQIPSTGIQPRMALGFSLKAILKLMHQEETLRELSSLVKVLKPDEWEEPGKNLAKRLMRRVPVIYASRRNVAVAYNWKIKLNETGKIPAFYNIFPELNHNEMTGFDVKPSTKKLSENLSFLIFIDSSDYSLIQKRMRILGKLYLDRGLHVEFLELAGGSTWQKVFSALLFADWTAVHLAHAYKLEPEEVPMVEEFKHLIVQQDVAKLA